MKKPTSISKSKKDSESKLYLTEATSELSVKYLKNEYDSSSNMLTSNKNEFFILKYNLESILNELRSMTQRLKDGDEEEGDVEADHPLHDEFGTHLIVSPSETLNRRSISITNAMHAASRMKA